MNTADMMIHVHPAVDAKAIADLEIRLMRHLGVDCAEFSQPARPHSLVVKYDPDAVDRMEILQMVRTIDPDAISVGC